MFFFFLGGGAGLGFSRFRVQGLGFGGLVPLGFWVGPSGFGLVWGSRALGEGWSLGLVRMLGLGLWDILHFPVLCLRGSYLLIFFNSFKSPT